MAESPQDLVTKYKDILAQSRTAYAPNVEPTTSDVRAERQLRRAQSALDRARSEELKRRWYGEGEEEDEMGSTGKAERGTFGKVLHALGTPLYASVGAVEAALGKGTEKGLVANVRANIEEEGTYGDLLRAYGVPQVAALPVGLAMDFALDPFSWGTLGTGALVPRTAYGLYKGGLAGAKAGALSRVLPGVRRFGELLPPGAAKGSAKEGVARAPTFLEKVSDISSKAEDDWTKIYDVEKRLKEGNIIDRALTKTGVREKWVDFKKTEKGEKVAEFFEYSPMQWVREARKELQRKKRGVYEVTGDDPFSEFGRAGAGAGRPAVAAGDDVGRDILEAIDVATDPKMARVRDALTRTYAAMGEAENISMRSKDTWKEISNLEKAIKSKDRKYLGNFVDILEADAKVAAAGKEPERLEKFLTTFRTLKADVDGYDQWVARTMLRSGKLEEAMRKYAQFIFLFKTAKIGGGMVPGTPLGAVGTNSILGNPAMAGMSGVDVFNPKYMGALKDALDVTVGSDYNKTLELFSDPATVRLLMDEGDIVRSIVGVDPRFLLEGHEYINKVHGLVGRTAMLQGKIGDMTEIEAFLNNLSGTIDDAYINAARKLIRQGAIKDVNKVAQINKDILAYRKIKDGAQKVGKGAEDVADAVVVASRADTARIMNNVRSVVEQSLPGSGRTTFMAQEILAGEGGKMINKVRQKALETDNLLWKATAWYLAKPMDIFSKIDQTYKLGLFHHLKRNGVTERELMLMGRRFGIGADDYVRSGDKFILTPAKSLEVANEVFMNYMAMPGFVKIMRNMPMIGSPFISFSYAATAQIAKTAVHNPAFFNKVQFAIKEISGRKGPLEKEALESKYYKWLNRPGMVKIPFFQDSPVYLNAENMLFHYSAGFLQDPERSYENRYGGAFVEAMDRVPFLMKEPAGRVLMDYIILPTLLGEALGTFGQPLWPEDASMVERAGHTAAAAAETVMPGFAGYAGPVLPGVFPESWQQFYPSYGAGQLAQAVRGRTTIGAEAKEPVVQRTARVISRMLGFPVYYMNLSYQERKND